MYFHWQLLVILFADYRAKQLCNYTFCELGKGKLISGEADFHAAARHVHGFKSTDNRGDHKMCKGPLFAKRTPFREKDFYFCEKDFYYG